MRMHELIGAPVEVAPPGFDLADPVIDVSLPEGFGHVVATATHAILRAEGVGTFAIVGGNRVRFEPAPAADERAVSVWLHGTVSALLLAQRGHFALHASVVDVDGTGVAVAGARRTGKSTTALRLTQRGHPLVTDDVSPLLTNELVIVHPYTRPTHVFAETAALLGLDVSSATPVLPEHPKVALAPAGRPPIALRAICVLSVSGAVPDVGTARVEGADAHMLIERNLYRAALLRELWQTEMFSWAAKVARAVPVHVVTRPAGAWTVDDVADAVERIALSGSRSAA